DRNPLGDKGAEAIAASENATALEQLSLSYCKIGDRGAVALASSPHLGRLRELSLDNNPIAVEGASALLRLPGTVLLQLGIYDPTLPAEVKAALAARREAGLA